MLALLLPRGLRRPAPGRTTRSQARLGTLLLGATAWLFLAPAAGTAQLPAPDGDLLTLEHYVSWEGVASPQLSPDGQQIVYTRRFMDPVNDRWASALWIMNADGTRNRFLVEGSSPAWSPDGTRIAYTASGEPGGSQIHVRWMDAEGATSQVTRLEHSPSNIEWSPDGTQILFQSFVPSDPDPAWRIDLPRAPRGAEWAGSPVIEDRIHFRRDGQGWTPRGHQHLFVVDAEAGQPLQVTHGDWDHSSARWMPDGESIVFQSHRVPDAERLWRESHLYRVDVESREITRLTEVRGPKGNPTPSSDGALIAFSGYEWVEDTYIESSLYVMNADGST